jgi:[protein-PII] uridylyltransferase
MHEDDRAALEFLVRNHLLMSMLAQTRDVEDPNLVVDFVKEVGTAENLTLLYLLTFADMRAVGPQIWNSWKDHLLADLYSRAVEVFETGVVTEADMESRADRTRRRLLERAAGGAERSRLESFLAALPTSYFLGNPDEKIIDHWRLFESVGASVFRHGVEHFPERGFSEFTICARDRLGLFRDMVGALSSCGLNILSVRLVTSSTGWALDVFRIEHKVGDVDAASGDVWMGVADTLDSILAGKVDAAELVRKVLLGRARRIGEKHQPRRGATRVEIDNRQSREFTVVDVYAGDRPGLLFLIADAIYALGLDIHLAKITTHLTAVLDVFYVTDAGRSKIEDVARLDEIRRSIVAALDPEEAQNAAAIPA